MRILYCNKFSFAFSGTEAHLFELMDLVRDRGHQTALFAMQDARGQAAANDRFIPLIDFKNGGTLLHRARLAGHAVYSFDARRRLRRMIEEFRPDVAHVRNIYHHLSPSILWELRSQRIPVVYHVNDFKLVCPSCNLTAHGRVCERCSGGRFWEVARQGCHPSPAGSALVLMTEAYLHRWLRTYEKCVDCFLTPSHFAKAKLIENGWKADRIRVLPHFQNVPRGDVPPPSENAPILYFGRLSQEKGIADLLLAMRLVPDLRLHVAGHGPQLAELEMLVRSLAIDNVDFVGHKTGPELDELIATAGFTVFPSRAYETLGKSILESYAWARAVVASDLGSRRELVQHGHTGLLFPPGDVEQLADAISHLARHPEVAAQMGLAGRELVRNRHAPEQFYRELADLYEQLRSRTPASSRALNAAPASPKLRIAFIGGRGVISKYCGIETHYEEVGRRLCEMGHEVTVYCRTYFTPRVERHAGMRLVRMSTVRSKHLDTLVHTLRSTLHAMFTPVDIVHYHALGPALFSFLPRLAGKKTVVTVQGLDWQRKKWGKLAALVLRVGEKASVTLPNATVVVSTTLQQHYREWHGVETVHIPNGTDIRRPHTASRLAQWGLAPGKYLLYAGRFSPEKNCHQLIEAYRRIETPVKLVLAGGSSYSDAYVSELRKHASENIRVLDWVSGPDLEELLAGAMVFVLPSEVEGLSLALLDAMGAGVCVLASDIAENREVVDGVGFTFKRNDVDDLERMLRLLMSDPRTRQQAGRSGRARVRERYLWSKVAEQTAELYQKIVTTGKATQPAISLGEPAETSKEHRSAA